MYLYTLGLKNGDIYLVKSRETIDKILEDLDTYTWNDYVLAENRLAGYIGEKAVKNNVVVVKSDEVVTVGLYAKMSNINRG